MVYLSAYDTLSTLRERFPAAARVYVAGCSGEPLGVAEAFRRAPELAKDLTFLGIWIPRVNATDWAGLHPSARAESIFLSPALRPSFEASRTDFRPLSYTQSWDWLGRTRVDAALIMVSPPDARGHVSLGVSADFSHRLMARGDVYKVALINPHMPMETSGGNYGLEMFDLIGEAGAPLVQVPPVALPDRFVPLADHVASLIEAGDTLQFGLGNLQQAVMGALADRRGLAIHAGMISDPVLDLLDTGAIDAVTTGVAIGTDALYARAGRDPRISFSPVGYTHAISTLSEIENFKAINSVIEVDLFGQANAEFIRGRQVSGTGGLVDFLRGARVSRGGRAITGLLSTAKGGTLSRIVARLPADATSIARADMDVVVTEHGIADLRDKTIDARAEALISIADPAFRDKLGNAWDEMRRAM